MKKAHSAPKKTNDTFVFIIGIAILIGGYLAFNYFTKPQFQKATLKTPAQQHSGHYQASGFTPTELNQTLHSAKKDEYVVIDVRTQQEYDKGHIPGAVHADYYDADALKKAAGDKTPIVYCSRSIMRGPYAAYNLYQHGKTHVRFLDGGLSAWAEDIEGLDSNDPNVRTVFNHPKNIYPERALNLSTESPLGDVVINLQAAKYEFSPRVIKVKQGQRVTLNMISLDVVHGFALPEFGIEEELPPHEEKTVSFVADRKGNFPFVCNVICGAGHDHASMVGNLIVE